MADGIDEAASAFATEVAAPASRPRDSQGKYVRETSAPEPMFVERRVEGNPITGDTSDGGDNVALRAREQEIADGYGDEPRPSETRQRAPDDSEVDHLDEPEQIGAIEDETGNEIRPEGDEEPDDSARYEVTIDGRPFEVSLKEALAGYVRQATFHQRMEQINTRSKALDADFTMQQQGWAMWHKARKDYEEDLANLVPSEPNWDQEFARDPHSAHAQQKVFQLIYAKLAQSRQERANREAWDTQERDRRTQKFAVDGFSKFVMDHIKSMPDEPTLKKNIQSMRRTAMAAGFSEFEVATVYDPRMLDVLWKASKYDRMTATAPRAVVSGKGRTLTPGAATPFNGNARRSGFDDAQRQLARSGKLDDAAEVFRRLL